MKNVYLVRRTYYTEMNNEYTIISRASRERRLHFSSHLNKELVPLSSWPQMCEKQALYRRALKHFSYFTLNS